MNSTPLIHSNTPEIRQGFAPAPDLPLDVFAVELMMIVIYIGDIKRLWYVHNFGMILVKFRTFAIGGFHAAYPERIAAN